jgi:hypothetical protein
MTIIQFQFSKSFIEEKFEDTKRMIRSRKSKNRQCDGQKKKNYMTNNEGISVAQGWSRKKNSWSIIFLELIISEKVWDMTVKRFKD